MLRVETVLCSAGRAGTGNTEPQPYHTTFFPSKTGSVWPAAWDYKLLRKKTRGGNTSRQGHTAELAGC